MSKVSKARNPLFIYNNLFCKFVNSIKFPIYIFNFLLNFVYFINVFLYVYIFFQILENRSLVSSRDYKDLLCKNNRIKTGYENFCIKKGSMKLFPYKDFDFVGKHVVCQKCFKQFPSKLSYKEHVGTGICVRTYNGQNPIYLKYKNRNNIQNSKKNKRKIEEDFQCYDMNNFFLNPEMLNTLQTRNKCYYDIKDEYDEVETKPMNNSNKKESTIKKPKGRPTKIIAGNKIEIKKRSRPNSLEDVTFYNSSKNDNSLKILGYKHADDAYKNNINERTRLKPVLASKIKNLSKSFWKAFKNQQIRKGINTNTYEYPSKHQTQYNEDILIFFQIKELENALKFLSKKILDKNELNELELMVKKLSKVREEYKLSKLKNTDMVGDEGIENIQCTLKNNENETENEMKKKCLE